MTTPKRGSFLLALVTAIAIGAMLSVQSRINGDLGASLDDGLTAAVISFGVGFVALLVVVGVSPRSRTGLANILGALRSRRIPYWYAAGGIAGALYVLSQTATVAFLGVAMFTVAAVAGQVIGGMVIDRVGVGSMRPKAITIWRLVGALVALGAVVLAMVTRIQQDIPLWMLLLPFIAGVLQGWQQAVNGQLREHGTAASAAVISFAAGLSALLIAAGISWAVTAPPAQLPTEWWLYVGGVLGAVYIVGGAALVRALGVLILGLCVVAGQLASSLVLDLVMPREGVTVDPTTVIGTLITLVAIVIATMRPRRRISRRQV